MRSSTACAPPSPPSTDPELRRPLGELDMVREIAVREGVAEVGIALTIVGCPAADRIERDVRAAAASVDGVSRVEVAVGVMSPDERRALTERLRGGRAAREMPFGPDSLTRVIAVTSGKGGVGKSTITANLAVALAARGLRVRTRGCRRARLLDSGACWGWSTTTVFPRPRRGSTI